MLEILQRMHRKVQNDVSQLQAIFQKHSIFHDFSLLEAHLPFIQNQPVVGTLR